MGTGLACLWCGLFCVGFAGMALQYLWIRMLGTALGLEVYAIAGVTSAWLGGLAVGAWCDRRRPLSFSALQGMAAAGGLVSWGLFGLLGDPLSAVHGGIAGHWGLFGGMFLLLLPATLAMGATLPAAERIVRRRLRYCVGWIFGLYALGSTAGVLAAAFLLAPGLGLRTSMWTCIGALAAIALACRSLEGGAGEEEPPPASGRWIPTAFALGGLGILWQMGCVRTLSQVLENSVYTHAALLSVYLGGTSLGAFLYQRLALRSRDALFWGLALSAVLAMASLHAMAASHFLHQKLWSAGGPFRLFLLELGLAAWTMLPAALAMGALLSHVLQRGGAMGSLLCWNLAGAALAPLAFFTLLPLIGIRATLMLAALGYVLLLLPMGGRRFLAGLAPTLVLAGLAPGTDRLLGLDQGPLREGPAATVRVVSDALGNRTLVVNRRFVMGGTGAVEPERDQALLPLALAPGARRVMVLGVGTGITLGAAQEDPRRSVVAAEILPEVIGALPLFAPENRHPWPGGRVTLLCMDARRMVRRHPGRFDLILSDVFHPARDGAGLLYTREHFQAASGRLAPGGLFCQWLPLHQLDAPALRSVVRTFLSVFGHASLWWLEEDVHRPVLALMGSTEAVRMPDRPGGGGRYGSPLELARLCLAGRQVLEEWSRGGEINTDDNQLLVYRAPWIGSREAGRPWTVLEPLLGMQRRSGSLAASALWPGGAPEGLRPRLRARQPYLEGLIAEAGGRERRALALWLESLALDPSFTAPMARCVAAAARAAATDPGAARRLLERLLEIRPGLPLVQGMLDRIGP